MANSVYEFLSNKLPISRLQRDLTDSTVVRNIGVPVGHSILAFKSSAKGLRKLSINKTKIKEDLNNNWQILTEAIQTILRTEGVDKPYELVKELSRGKTINKQKIEEFVKTLNISKMTKDRILKLKPDKYTGIASNLVRHI